MSTYTAEEFNKKPQEAYRQADKGEPVKINHNRYPDVIFELSARERGIDSSLSKEIDAPIGSDPLSRSKARLMSSDMVKEVDDNG
jgi:hypothetical protein